MEQVLSESIAQRQFNVLLLTIFAGLAMLLATIGIYGVMSYSVAQRTHEIGLRMALGAGRGEILRLILRQGMKLTAIGILAGFAAAFGATRVLNAMLYGISATDPWTFVAMAVMLAAVAAIACYIPARRAMHVDPLVALRYE
jgi:putative ABC transport system permease protein